MDRTLESIADDLRNLSDGFSVYDVAVVDEGDALSLVAPVDFGRGLRGWMIVEQVAGGWVDVTITTDGTEANTSTEIVDADAWSILQAVRVNDGDLVEQARETCGHVPESENVGARALGADADANDPQCDG